MSRKKTQAEQEAEALAADEANAKRYREQQECCHWNCLAAEWYFSGAPRLIRCLDCGAENDLEEPST